MVLESSTKKMIHYMLDLSKMVKLTGMASSYSQTDHTMKDNSLRTGQNVNKDNIILSLWFIREDSRTIFSMEMESKKEVFINLMAYIKMDRSHSVHLLGLKIYKITLMKELSMKVVNFMVVES